MSDLADSTIETAIAAWIQAGSGLAADHILWAEQNMARPDGMYIDMALSVEPVGRDGLNIQDAIITIPTQAVTLVTPATDTLTVPNHGLNTGDGPFTFTTTGTLPGGLALTTNYWPVVIDANNFKVAISYQNARATSPVVVDITSAGTGVHSINGTLTSARAGAEITAHLLGTRRATLTLQCFGGLPTPASPAGGSSPYAVLRTAVMSYALPTKADALSAAGIGVLKVERMDHVGAPVNSILFEPRARAVVHLSLAAELVESLTYIQVVNETNQVVTPPQTFTVQLP